MALSLTKKIREESSDSCTYWQEPCSPLLSCQNYLLSSSFYEFRRNTFGFGSKIPAELKQIFKNVAWCFKDLRNITTVVSVP